MKKALLFVTLLSAVLVSSCYTSEKSWNRLEKKINSKPIARKYSGGHTNYTCLVLYKDSTFFYIDIGDIMGIASKKTGTYTIDSTSLSLYGKKKQNSRVKPKPEVFRIRGNKVLLYSEKDEASKDSSFYRDYYTLKKDE